MNALYECIDGAVGLQGPMDDVYLSPFLVGEELRNAFSFG